MCDNIATLARLSKDEDEGQRREILTGAPGMEVEVESRESASIAAASWWVTGNAAPAKGPRLDEMTLWRSDSDRVGFGPETICLARNEVR